MIKAFSFMAATAMFAAPATAQDFSTGSKAKSWNLYAEVPAQFEAQVVDIMCELTGDCPADCGSGTRQLGLIRTLDNVMVLPMKNSQAAFSGAAIDLAPYCRQTVEVDGLMIEDPDLNVANIYLVQRVKTADGDWAKANQFTKKWAAAHPEAKGKGPWFRRDPRVKKAIASEGYLGLGLETDEAFIKEYFE
ncbi:MAG: hypothetical protein ABJI96_16970 [Paracoccaceae bacterium]